jgi:hypothetical protein
LSRLHLRACIVGDGFPFNKKTGGFDFIVQILNFMSWVNSKAPVQRRVFGACVGEKHPLVALYLDKVFAPQVVSFVVRDLASFFLPSYSDVLARSCTFLAGTAASRWHHC